MLAPSPFLRLSLFEGPLDLLLHLCRRHELSPADLPVAQITEQFLTYLEVMEELQIEIAGEFVEMAALLCLIKSRDLLPRTDLPEELLDEGPDPRAELVARLLDYKAFREAGRELDARPKLNEDFFVRGQDPLEAAGLERSDAPIDADLVDLLSALRDLLERRSALPPIHAVGGAEYVPIEQRIDAILNALRHADAVAFDLLFDDAVTRGLVVATFLALLELARLRLVGLVQDGHLEAIVVERRFEGEPPPLERLHDYA